jgi:6-phosphogluconolactonase
LAARACDKKNSREKKMKALKAWNWIPVVLSALLLAACGGGSSGGGGQTNVTVPNVVGMTQAAASSAITGAGLTVGAVSTASSSTVASGNVISESPAAGASVAKGSAVGLSVSSGPATVAVPNVVGTTQAVASTAITGAGLVVGTVTMASSSSVVSGSVISESPTSGTTVAVGSAVNLTVSTGATPVANHFAYVANGADSTLGIYALNSATGVLTALASSPVSVPGGSQLSELKIDPSRKFLYVLSLGTAQVYGFSINATTGALAAVAGSPFSTGNGPQSMSFDASGAYLYVTNVTDNTISEYSLNAVTGVLAPLSGSPLQLTTGSNPAQVVRAGNFLYVTYQNSSTVEVFPISPTDGTLTVGVAGSPFATDTDPYSVAVDPAGTVLYTANAGSGSGSISAFQIDSTTGVLTPFASGGALPIPANNDIAIDPQGKFLFVTEKNTNGVVDVYPIDASSSTGLDAAVAGSPFSTGGNNPNSVSFDPSGKFVYVGNDGSANVAQFSLATATGVLTPVGPPVAAGNNPDFVAVY